MFSSVAYYNFHTPLFFREIDLGPSHPATLYAICIFADLYIRANNLREGLDLYSRALNDYERELGPDNSLTLNILDQIGEVYDKYVEEYGSENCETLYILDQVGMMYDRINVSDGGEEESAGTGKKIFLMIRTLKGYECSVEFGVDHPTTIKTVKNLANIFKKQRNFSKSEVLYRRVLSSYEQQYGTEHIETIKLVLTLGVVLKNLKKLDDAEFFYYRALKGKFFFRVSLFELIYFFISIDVYIYVYIYI
jgi:tetratricopeptide (TPR) repeat protein